MYTLEKRPSIPQFHVGFVHNSGEEPLVNTKKHRAFFKTKENNCIFLFFRIFSEMFK